MIEQTEKNGSKHKENQEDHQEIMLAIAIGEGWQKAFFKSTELIGYKKETGLLEFR